MKELYKKYIREYTFPEIFCPGCGYGIFLNAFVRALDELGIKKGDIGIVSGGGCGAWMGMNLDVDVFKCLHGRSIAFAEGVKIARPDKPVVAFTGDGENVGIGGNHMIHAARRNIDITCFQLTNLVYGMTGAQKAPTTPLYGKTKTSPYGNEEEPFDVGRLCIAAGATYFARWTTAHPVQLQKAICEAIQHKGFSVVEVISQCPTGAGRNMYGTDQGYEIMDMFKKTYTPLRPGEEPDITNTSGRLGKFYEVHKPTFMDTMDAIKKERNLI